MNSQDLSSTLTSPNGGMRERFLAKYKNREATSPQNTNYITNIISNFKELTSHIKHNETSKVNLLFLLSLGFYAFERIISTNLIPLLRVSSLEINDLILALLFFWHTGLKRTKFRKSCGVLQKIFGI